MDTWDLVKIYSRAFRPEHYIEALSVGYQMIEFILEFVLTTQPIGKDKTTIPKTKIRKLKYLMQKADVALEEGFITQDIYENIKTFNRLRADIIHNLVENNVKPEDIKLCANMVSDIYYSIQSQFMKLEVGEWKKGHIQPASG